MRLIYRKRVSCFVKFEIRDFRDFRAKLLKILNRIEYIDKTIQRGSLSICVPYRNSVYIAKKSFSRVQATVTLSTAFSTTAHFSHSRALDAICCAEFAYISY